jgi:hypothetical protein
MSVARLSRNQGKRDEAYDLLAPTYNWFTEGFDTLDLKEAEVRSASWCRPAFGCYADVRQCVRLRSLTQTRL